MSDNYSLLLNQFKKHCIYGKPLEEIKDQVMRLSEDQMDILDAPEYEDDLELTQDQAESLHALFGLVTEVGEIIPIMMKYIFANDKLDVAHLSEELTDTLWYTSVLVRKFNLDPAKMMDQNIAKLRTRYPDKFTSECALNRDLDAEQAAMNG
jgi:NTP pyrophosphatase (non-canonical NTP hydrolase)